MKTEAFDFSLPQELIAQHPKEPRDQARLMVVDRRLGAWEHLVFSDLPERLAAGDLLVRNNTKVFPARLLGHRERTGGKWEGLFLRATHCGSWEVLATTRGRPMPGERVVVGEGLVLVLESQGEGGRWSVRPEAEGTPQALLERHGMVPLPPYIRKGREGPGDRVHYQTIYAREPGAVAAPTAGLHFTQSVFDRLAARGIHWIDATLHVGLGTFKPIETDSIEDHPMHAEWGSLTLESADRLNRIKTEGGRIAAVGTTSVRLLETAAAQGRFEPFDGETALYIQPGHVFRGVDALVTNFHLPRSTLLVLVSAFAGFELARAAYAEAIRERYRFYSYGDAMLIL
jgi:S-adenosylmethionine:tRNA ribosyltransferase-isomerase